MALVLFSKDRVWMSYIDVEFPLRTKYLFHPRPIMDWANEENRPGVGPFSSTSIEDVRFDSLTVRLGQPYLYQHQGDCEHLIIFSDIR